MSDYRRNYVAGGTYFFTVVTEKRRPILHTGLARKCLREAFLYCRQDYPFKMDAIIMMPNHIHAIWTLPDGDFDYSKRWGIIKKYFTQSWLAHGGSEMNVSKSKQRYRRRGVWQRRFWEHTLRDQEDYNRHFDYLHYNPIKHGVYDKNWGSEDKAYFNFSELDNLEQGTHCVSYCACLYINGTQCVPYLVIKHNELLLL